MTKQIKSINLLTAFLVAGIALSAFILSFGAVRSLAIENGVPEGQAWLIPVIVDGAIVVFSLNVLRGFLVGEPTRMSWALVFSFTCVSIVFNIGHNHATPFGIFISILVPLTLLTSFETLMSQIKFSLRQTAHNKWQNRAKALFLLARKRRVESDKWQKLAELRQAESDKWQKLAESRQTELDRHQHLIQAAPHLGQQGNVMIRVLAGLTTVSDAAKQLQVTRRTIERNVAKLNGGS